MIPSPITWFTVPSKWWTASISRSSTRSRSLRASSGSRSARSSIEPLRSAKSTVTCLRSPSRAPPRDEDRSARWLGRVALGDGVALGRPPAPAADAAEAGRTSSRARPRSRSSGRRAPGGPRTPRRTGWRPGCGSGTGGTSRGPSSAVALRPLTTRRSLAAASARVNRRGSGCPQRPVAESPPVSDGEPPREGGVAHQDGLVAHRARSTPATIPTPASSDEALEVLAAPWSAGPSYSRMPARGALPARELLVDGLGLLPHPLLLRELRERSRRGTGSPCRSSRSRRRRARRAWSWRSRRGR